MQQWATEWPTVHYADFFVILVFIPNFSTAFISKSPIPESGSSCTVIQTYKSVVLDLAGNPRREGKWKGECAQSWGCWGRGSSPEGDPPARRRGPRASAASPARSLPRTVPGNSLLIDSFARSAKSFTFPKSTYAFLGFVDIPHLPLSHVFLISLFWDYKDGQ